MYRLITCGTFECENLLNEKGVFNAFIGLDSLLFLDPQLLISTTIPEFKGSHEKLKKYYQEIITLLSASEKKFDRAWMESHKRLVFKETPGSAIGYGKANSAGSGIGPKLAIKLVESAEQIIAMGIKDPAIFELLGLFEEDFGADRLSDMTIRIIREDIFAYTQRVCLELKIEVPIKINVNGNVYSAPLSPINNKPLLFLPYELLRDLPIALSWEDIGNATSLNQELRNHLNSLIAEVWGDEAKKPAKPYIKKIIMKDPEGLRALLEAYKKTVAGHYDFHNDPKGFLKWSEFGKDFALKNPLELALSTEPTLGQVEEVVIKIIKQFQRNIEVNNLKLHLYSKDGLLYKPLHEKYAQLLFYSVADSYCAANNLDLSPEANSGNGPVDFKISRGYHLRVLVEIKLTSNTNLVSGLTEQLGAYEQSEGTTSSMYVVIRVTQTDNSTKRVTDYRDKLVQECKRVPNLFIVDATIKPPASKRRRE